MDHINNSALVVYRPPQCHASTAVYLLGSKYDMQVYNTALDICSYALSSYILYFKLNMTLAID